jgi:CubicO group peptidase (beta-lactamase class C family)
MIRITVLILAAAGLALAQPSDARARVDRVFARYTRATPGCAVGVSVKGEPVLTAGYGMADLEHDVAITPETVFEPGSITKQITAAAVFLLAQQGKLSLDDPARKYIPELPEYGAPLTIRHLLNHTSGLRDWGEVAAISGWPRGSRAHTHDDVLEIVERQKALNYPPGADYSYTNTGYNLAAILVGRVAGKPLAQFTKDAIFTPLGMRSTEWRDDYRRIVKNRAMAYSPSNGTFLLNMPFEFVYGNGGLLTTVGDLLRWNRNFTAKTVGGQALYDAQHRQGRLNDGRIIAYAGGLMVLHYRGYNEVSHSGSTAGYSAWLGRYPDQDVSVAVLCNVAGNATAYGHQVADVYLPAGPAEPAPQRIAAEGLYRSIRDGDAITFPANRSGKIDIDGSRVTITTEVDRVTYEKVDRWTPTAAELESLAGEYVSGEAEASFTLVVESGRLVLHRRRATRVVLTPTYRDAFAAPSIGNIHFLRDGAGMVRELSLGEPRVWDMRFQRTK